jgi:hypothetical protein
LAYNWLGSLVCDKRQLDKNVIRPFQGREGFPPYGGAESEVNLPSSVVVFREMGHE